MMKTLIYYLKNNFNPSTLLRTTNDGYFEANLCIICVMQCVEYYIILSSIAGRW